LFNIISFVRIRSLRKTNQLLLVTYLTPLNNFITIRQVYLLNVCSNGMCMFVCYLLIWLSAFAVLFFSRETVFDH